LSPKYAAPKGDWGDPAGLTSGPLASVGRRGYRDMRDMIARHHA